MAYYPFATEIGAEYTLTNAALGAVAQFNNPFKALYTGMLTEVTGLDSPEVRESAEDLAQADGGTHGYFYFGRRPITMTARIFGHASIAERNIRMDRIRRASLAMRSDSVLSWKPSTRQENLLANPSAEIDTTGWQGSGGQTPVITRSTTRAVAGTASFRVTGTASTANGQGAGLMTGATTIPCAPGETVHLMASVWNAGTANLIELRPRFIAADGTTTVFGTSASTSTKGAWVNLTTSQQAPAGTAYVRIDVVATSSASGQTFDTYMDAALMQIGGTAPVAYFDGNTAGYFWQGDPNASASGDFIEMFTYVRRQGPLRESGEWVKEIQIPLVSEFAGMYSVQAKTLSAAGGAGLVAENRGSWPASPILRITGASASNPSITGPNGSVINTTGSLLVASGETMEIDTLNHTATFTAGPRTAGGTGNANQYINFATTIWPTMPTGNSTFTLSGTGTLTAVWRDTWM